MISEMIDNALPPSAPGTKSLPPIVF